MSQLFRTEGPHNIAANLPYLKKGESPFFKEAIHLYKKTRTSQKMRVAIILLAEF